MMPPSVPAVPSDVAWRVAGLCDAGNCVRVAASGDVIIIGDSKNPDGSVLTYSRAEWVAFTEGIRQGDFDDL